MDKELYDKLDAIEDSILDARDEAEIAENTEAFDALEEAVEKVQEAMAAVDPKRFAQR